MQTPIAFITGNKGMGQDTHQKLRIKKLNMASYHNIIMKNMIQQWQTEAH